MAANTILILENDQASGRRISRLLKRARHPVTVVSDPRQAIRPSPEPLLIVLDVVSGPLSAADVCREIRASPTLVAVPVMVIAQSDAVEERIRFLEVGADDVIAKPFDDREFEARIEALLMRFHRSKGLVPTAAPADVDRSHEVRMVAVFSPKGGSGTTTIAVNLAAAMAIGRPDRVVLVDLHLQFGSVAAHLNVSDERSLSDLAQESVALQEPALLRSYATRHDSGLHVLAAPRSPELAEHVAPEDVSLLLETILSTYEVVVIDAGSTLDERTIAALEAADAIILPFYPEIAALKAVNVLIDYLDATGSLAAKVTFVANNLFARQILKMRDVEQALGTKVAVEMPYDPFVYLKAANEGIPLVVGAPRSPAAAQFSKFAASIFGSPGASEAKAGQPKQPRGFVGLLRRS